MTKYLIGAINIRDHERYAEYIEKADASARGRNVLPLAVDDAPVLLEGELPAGRIIIMQFEKGEDLQAWYNSDAYRDAKKARGAAAETPFLIAVEAGWSETPESEG
jgi:uncharacterized protein (DUF1330 family)